MARLLADHHQKKGNDMNLKENETVNRGELESINSEMFNSFDLEDASWVIGGKPKISGSASNFVATTDNGGFSPQADVDADVQF
jgi:hypothetical protein